MTREEAETEIMQIYGSLSEEKKMALDVAFKALEQADNIPVMYYPQVDGITPTVVAQADGEYITQSAGDEIRQKNYDLISRQAVLKIIDGWYEQNRDTENIEDLIVLITYMDSVRPQEPQKSEENNG